jgi:hypothetical protein
MLRPSRKNIFYLILFTALVVLFFSGGGLVVTIIEDSVQPATATIATLGAVAAAALLLVSISVGTLLKTSRQQEAGITFAGQRKQLLFSIMLFIAITAVTLALMNTIASFFTVPWPMNGLHGVSSAVGRQAWEYQSKADGYARINSWGQKDREHPLTPSPGTYRVIFIGDSFLEQGALVPLPVRTEELLKGMGLPSYELINLGVSASDPDEYFYRLKKIGLPLRPNHCIMTFYAGNDFIQEPTLLSYGGISSTYPRWSFLQALGLTALDQVISNERRQVLRAWFRGGALLKHELELQEIFGKTANDRETEDTFLSFFPAGEQVRLKSVLDNSSAAARSRFFSMLRHPDEGKFRSNYLDVATKAAQGMPAPEFIAAEYSFRWVKAAFDLCRKNGVKFTLVVIPDGASVDSRMSGQYAAVADMKAFMKHKDEAVSRLVKHAADAGMDVVDLRELLLCSPGAYLNMDGHWSQYGADLVAGCLAERLAKATRFPE